jgi:predicted MFS family arabinose efflux permease
MFLQYAPAGAMLPQYSLLLHKLGFSDLETAACCSTQAVATVFASLLAGHIADRWISAERLLGACALLAGLDLWVLADQTELVPVFLITLVFWLLSGPIWLLGATIGFAHLKHPERQFGPVRLWGTVGWMTAAWLVAYWFDNPNWLEAILARLRPEHPSSEMTDMLRIGGVLSFVLTAYSLTLPRTPPQPVHDGKPAPLAALRLLRGRAFFVYALCLFGVCATYPFGTQGTPLLLDQLGVSRSWMPRILTLAQVTEVICLGLLPMLLLRLGTRGTMLLGLAGWTTALVAQAVGRPVELVAGSLCFNGLCIAGVFVAGQVFVNGLVHGGLRASAQSLFTFVNGLGMLLGNLLFGWLRLRAGGEMPQAFAVGAIVMTFLVLLFLFGFPERRSEVQPPLA